LLELPSFGWTWLNLDHDGLEREFKIFSELEVSVRTTCAPEDQEKSIDGKRRRLSLE
jgi:hypothetical protein